MRCSCRLRTYSLRKLRVESYHLILQRYFGYDDFRGIQREIIESIGSGHDTLGLMPTGGGKSICFQVPALAMEGVCIVITPLIALMKDQVQHLRQRGIMAAAIYTGMTHDQVLRTLDNCILGSTRFLYVSPERLQNQLFVTKLRHMRISFITVDEAHCISQWGYDFRPAYLQISTLRTLLPDVPVLALTATATPQVIDDICQKLSTRPQASLALTSRSKNSQLSSFKVFRMSFERTNLSYMVRHSNDKYEELLHLLSQQKSAAIVYVRSRRKAHDIAQQLSESGVHATYYHAGLDPAEKDQHQHDWQQGHTPVIVATNAFGMGIDKADVRLVVHYDLPDSLEAYFQEAGRAGRDGLPARAILLYNNSDATRLARRIEETFPPREYIRQVYEHLAYYFQLAVDDGYGITRQFDIDDFCRRFKHFPVRVHSALIILQRAGYIDYDEAPDQQARVHFLLERHELYRLHETAPDEERVIVALLRAYGGLFADFEFIDEAKVAQGCGLSPDVVHEVLKQLARRRILQFIPRNTVPTIQYLQRREDPEHVQLPPAVYEDRLEQYRLRINAMLHYAQSTDSCRSQLLLRYFGETKAKRCGHCDVCLEELGETVPTDDLQQACQLILDRLSDRQEHLLADLRHLPVETPTLDAAIQRLIDNEAILQQDGLVSVK